MNFDEKTPDGKFDPGVDLDLNGVFKNKH